MIGDFQLANFKLAIWFKSGDSWRSDRSGTRENQKTGHQNAAAFSRGATMPATLRERIADPSAVRELLEKWKIPTKTFN